MKNNAIIAAFKPVVDAAAARPWIPEGGQFFGPLDKMATEVLVQGEDAEDVPRRGRPSKYKAEVVPDYTGTDPHRRRRYRGPAIGRPGRPASAGLRSSSPGAHDDRHRRSRRPRPSAGDPRPGRLRRSWDKHWYAWAMVAPVVIVLAC